MAPRGDLLAASGDDYDDDTANFANLANLANFANTNLLMRGRSNGSSGTNLLPSPMTSPPAAMISPAAAALMSGRCPRCTMMTVKLRSGNGLTAPNFIYRGRCLLCYPLPPGVVMDAGDVGGGGGGGALAVPAGGGAVAAAPLAIAAPTASPAAAATGTSTLADAGTADSLRLAGALAGTIADGINDDDNDSVGDGAADIEGAAHHP